MPKIVQVTPAQVNAAKFKVKRSAASGKTVSPSVSAVANVGAFFLGVVPAEECVPHLALAGVGPQLDPDRVQGTDHFGDDRQAFGSGD